MASLLSLPNEVSLLILKQVHPRDWLSLRQTCKEIKAKTAHLVTEFFFQTRVAMLKRRSLQCLESIAKSESLSQSVQEIEICTSHLLPLDEVEEIEPPYCEYESMTKSLKGKVIPDSLVDRGIDYDEWYKKWHINNAEVDSTDEDERDEYDNRGDQSGQESEYNIRDNDSPTRNRLEQLNMREYQRHLYDQAHMMRTGYDVECLTQALARLKRCREISISTSIQAWGLRRLRRSIGILPQRGLTFQSKESIRQVHHIIQVVVTAIAASGISVEVLNIEPNSMLMDANLINPLMLMDPSSAILSKSSPASLRQLRISLDPESPLDDMIVGRKWEPDLIRFMHLLPKLSDLELDFQPRDETGRFSEIAKELYIPRLKRISLICIDTAAEGLAILLMRHHRTLQTVDLDNIQLSGALTSWRWLIEIVWSSLDHRGHIPDSG
ncbi:hypothetical protein FOXG_19689 [Fusarium oxysporum f. sp. lycopersici 4287]|uniref:F-box domain-containing protein n=1 Tax=Fusarium oxysporum f. sp. lycopersici (strain 4287 / CBS 123668 / FGSC 9935 / NRRL 34936) TaxID=426428 RepID=A0A0J9V6K3_FUSO4|nr:hypothetical protein FOXG_19689 [Fusarium oxysporum f. sp. lycopersici 4287]KAJ9419421.1 hypothetical protein QL093DRAFT_2363939 [Fusarium oxysporum]KNB06491.1 hypothetical protein FOXG_19689 [Fusarium oxysporum f. sp. lycopersici 4287]